jgi:predicted metal-dependent phosphoesterase TrpH
LIVDFHSHTYESDGSLSPQALADFMGERNVSVFSISDHDALSAYGSFTPPPGARVVTGIEINTTYRDNEVHVLGYNLPFESPALDGLIEGNVTARHARVERIVLQLQRAGYGITADDVRREGAHARALGRPHVAKALIRAGMVPDIEYAFRHLLRSGKPGYVPSVHVTPKTAIETIHAVGGTAILAHPGRLKDRAMIPHLVELGLDGLEVFYPLHDAEDVAQFRELCRKYALVMSAGSDFHDIRYHTRGVGVHVDDDDVRAFLDRVA